MEILDMKFAGIPIGTLIAVVVVWYFVRDGWREWREHRAFAKELDEAKRKRDDEYEWKPKMVNGVDCGEWVGKKDGRSLANIGYDVGLE
jgi:hypothetical protein